MGAIAKKFKRGEDVKLAIEAGNDMALICHETDSLTIAYDALQEVNSWTIDEALTRIHREQKRIPIPQKFTTSAWEENNRKIKELYTDIVGDTPPTDISIQSPVEEY